MKPVPFLNRFTSLPALLDALVHKRLTLLNPKWWEDGNDSYYIERYKQKGGFKTVLALCFTTKRETFHHWKVFSNGPSGVCVEFDRQRLIKGMSKEKGFRLGTVVYKYIYELEVEKPRREDWPFLKRKPFEDEGEFRIVYQSKTRAKKTKGIPFDIGCVLKISLSPWLPKSVAQTVIRVIKSVRGCENIRVIRSSLIDNARWRAVIEKTSST
jgi:hypothetical protein